MGQAARPEQRAWRRYPAPGTWGRLAWDPRPHCGAGSHTSPCTATHSPGDVSSRCDTAPEPFTRGFSSPPSALLPTTSLAWSPLCPSHRSATQHWLTAAAKGSWDDGGGIQGMRQDPMQVGKGQTHAETRAACSAQGTSISMPWEGSWLLLHFVAGRNTMKCPSLSPTPSHHADPHVCPPPG